MLPAGVDTSTPSETKFFIIDLEPLGGIKGGEIIAKGTPENIANTKKSFTGSFLKKFYK